MQLWSEMDSQTLLKALNITTKLIPGRISKIQGFVISGDKVDVDSDIFSQFPSIVIRNCCTRGMCMHLFYGVKVNKMGIYN
jgi:hypothetical protein